MCRSTQRQYHKPGHNGWVNDADATVFPDLSQKHRSGLLAHKFVRQKSCQIGAVDVCRELNALMELATTRLSFGILQVLEHEQAMHCSQPPARYHIANSR
jgi:hypothetical protein